MRFVLAGLRIPLHLCSPQLTCNPPDCLQSHLLVQGHLHHRLPQRRRGRQRRGGGRQLDAPVARAIGLVSESGQVRRAQGKEVGGVRVDRVRMRS